MLDFHSVSWKGSPSSWSFYLDPWPICPGFSPCFWGISPVFSAELLERLAQDDIACELAPGGYNSSVLSWRGAELLRPLFEALTPAVLRDMATPVDLDPGSPWSYENYPGWLLTDYTIYLFNIAMENHHFKYVG